jgi:hypothetical protein
VEGKFIQVLFNLLGFKLIPLFSYRYVTGTKDQNIADGIYDGTSLIGQSGGNVIVVTLNYRVCI